LMSATIQRPVHWRWFTLLTVFALCAMSALQPAWSGSQQINFELQSEILPDPSGDEKSTDNLAPGFTLAALLQPVQTILIPEAQSRVTGSDAYPGSILHGPPPPDYTA